MNFLTQTSTLLAAQVTRAGCLSRPGGCEREKKKKDKQRNTTKADSLDLFCVCLRFLASSLGLKMTSVNFPVSGAFDLEIKQTVAGKAGIMADERDSETDRERESVR